MFELRIPFDELPKIELNPNAIPTVKSMRRLSSEQVRDVLRSSWQDIQSPVCRELRDALLSSSPYSVVYDRGKLWIKLTRTKFNSSDSEQQPAMYVALREPVMPSTSAVDLLRFEMPGDARVLACEFLQCFGGLRDSPPNHAAGHWTTDTVSVIDGWFDDISSLGTWSGCPVLFYSAFGNYLLVGRDGSTAWHVLDRGCILQYTDTLEQGIHEYVRFLKHHPDDTFDYYSLTQDE